MSPDGLGLAEFWEGPTLRELAALTSVHTDAERLRNYRAGVIAEAVFSAFGGKREFEPFRYFEEKRKVASPQDIGRMFSSIANQYKAVQGRLK